MIRILVILIMITTTPMPPKTAITHSTILIKVEAVSAAVVVTQ